MIMLITCLKGLLHCWISKSRVKFSLPISIKCGPLISVVDFLELSGIELDHTLKREIVPDGMIYKCANLQKKLELEKYLFQGSK
jgi:hypothetical protein